MGVAATEPDATLPASTPEEAGVPVSSAPSSCYHVFKYSHIQDAPVEHREVLSLKLAGLSVSEIMELTGYKTELAVRAILSHDCNVEYLRRQQNRALVEMTDAMGELVGAAKEAVGTILQVMRDGEPKEQLAAAREILKMHPSGAFTGKRPAGSNVDFGGSGISDLKRDAAMHAKKAEKALELPQEEREEADPDIESTEALEPVEADEGLESVEDAEPIQPAAPSAPPGSPWWRGIGAPLPKAAAKAAPGEQA